MCLSNSIMLRWIADPRSSRHEQIKRTLTPELVISCEIAGCSFIMYMESRSMSVKLTPHPHPSPLTPHP